MGSLQEKIKNNWMIIAVIAIALAIRLYFFWITKGQTEWYDSGEYLSMMKHFVLGTPTTGFSISRELFTPAFWAIFYYFWRSEIPIRLIQVVLSTLTVATTFWLGKLIYDKWTGAIAALFMSFFWLHLFFSCRLLTYLYPPLFYTLALVLFYKGYCVENPKDRYLFLSFLTIIIGLGIYSSITFAAFTILLYLLFTEKFAFLKNKRLWKYGALSLPFLLVSFIPSYIVQGSLIPRLTQVAAATQQGTGLGWHGLLTYITTVPTLYTAIWAIAAIFSMLLVIRIFFYSDLLLKGTAPINVKKDLFVALGFAIQLIFYTYFAVVIGGYYDAWVLAVFPCLFILMTRIFIEIKDYISKKNIDYGKYFAILVLLIFAFSCYQQFQFADMAIKNKVSSYYNLHPAGEWLKANTNANETILASSVPQLTYYSERRVISFRDFENETQQQALQRIFQEHPKYMVLTVWERSPDWAYAMPINLNFTISQMYFLNPQQPDVIIYEIDYKGGA